MVDDKGDWVLTVAGTDVREVLWNDEDLEPGAFPGNAMGHRLIPHGYMPDRRAMYGFLTHSTVEKLMINMQAGWRRVGEKTWTIPCYPR
jgi:hypothetical protein